MVHVLQCTYTSAPMVLALYMYAFHLIQGGSNGEVVDTECVVQQDGPSAYEILLKVEERGHYVGCVKYQGQTIGPPTFTIICLSGSYCGFSSSVQF